MKRLTCTNCGGEIRVPDGASALLPGGKVKCPHCVTLFSTDPKSPQQASPESPQYVGEETSSKRRTWLAMLALVGAVVAVGGGYLAVSSRGSLWGGGPAAAGGTATPPIGTRGNGGQLTPEQLLNQASPGVVRIFVRDQYGKLYPYHMAGFFISDDGMLVTSDQLVTGGYSATVQLANGESLPVAGVLAWSRETCLALVKVEAKGLPYFALSQRAPQVGTTVYTIETPQGLPKSLGKGVVSGYHEHWRGVMQTTAPVRPGSPGGPLLTDQGEVVGVMYPGSDDSPNSALPVSFIQQLLDVKGRPVSLAVAAPEAKAERIARMEKREQERALLRTMEEASAKLQAQLEAMDRRDAAIAELLRREPWRVANNWRNLREGMSEDAVIRLLGRPDSKGTLFDTVTLWYSTFNVKLDARTRCVTGWTGPSTDWLR